MSSPVPEGRPRPPALPLPPASSAPPATVRRTPANRPGGGPSLVERTAHLFDPDRTPAVPPVPPAGDAVAAPAMTPITRTAPGHNGGPAVPDSGAVDPQQLDAVIAAVVERIEQRVVDELERRGRRTGRSGF